MGARKLERVPCRGGRGFSGRESRAVAHGYSKGKMFSKVGDRNTEGEK